MGVPAFYSWLIMKYPNIVCDNIESEYDNLYLDMTEMLYHVLHPLGCPSPVSTKEVIDGMCKYINDIFEMVQPRKLVYMAFDGVAPRAKMNEQRCRRFRAAKDASYAADEENNLRLEFEAQGKKLPGKNYMGVYFSHLVAPGTEFMTELSASLKEYINRMLNGDSKWKDIKVILSDANVPGEGEHKIMSFIRFQRNIPGYNEENACRHCVCGSDTDLIMLALATHEVNFSILRGLVYTTDIGEGEGNSNVIGNRKQRRYQSLHLFKLRECLKIDIFTTSNSNLENNDLERRVDDFICMCLFLGNDFLPKIPSLDISEGAVNLLLTIYKTEIVGCGKYLTEEGRPDLKNVERFIGAIGKYEDNTFRERSIEYKAQIEKFINSHPYSYLSSHLHMEERLFRRPQIGQSPWNKGVSTNEIYENKDEMKRKLKELLRRKSDTFNHGYKLLEEDKVKLGESGWKERYYREKFLATTAEEIYVVRKEVVMKYIEGLCWVMQYYHKGVPSWMWYYPYHYAPFASDLKDFGNHHVSFELGCPFKPFTQMLAITPVTNTLPLPKEYRKLVVNHDSPIKDLYPTDFEIDMDGKRYTWQGIVKLPFVDEERLLAEVAKVEDSLTADEVLRNSSTCDILFVSSRVDAKVNEKILK